MPTGPGVSLLGDLRRYHNPKVLGPCGEPLMQASLPGLTPGSSLLDLVGMLLGPVADDRERQRRLAPVARLVGGGHLDASGVNRQNQVGLRRGLHLTTEDQPEAGQPHIVLRADGQVQLLADEGGLHDRLARRLRVVQQPEERCVPGVDAPRPVGVDEVAVLLIRRKLRRGQKRDRRPADSVVAVGRYLVGRHRREAERHGRGEIRDRRVRVGVRDGQLENHSSSREAAGDRRRRCAPSCRNRKLRLRSDLHLHRRSRTARRWSERVSCPGEVHRHRRCRRGLTRSICGRGDHNRRVARLVGRYRNGHGHVGHRARYRRCDRREYALAGDRIQNVPRRTDDRGRYRRRCLSSHRDRVRLRRTVGRGDLHLDVVGTHREARIPADLGSGAEVGGLVDRDGCHGVGHARRGRVDERDRIERRRQRKTRERQARQVGVVAQHRLSGVDVVREVCHVGACHQSGDRRCVGRTPVIAGGIERAIRQIAGTQRVVRDLVVVRHHGLTGRNGASTDADSPDTAVEVAVRDGRAGVRAVTEDIGYGDCATAGAAEIDTVDGRVVVAASDVGDRTAVALVASERAVAERAIRRVEQGHPCDAASRRAVRNGRSCLRSGAQHHVGTAARTGVVVDIAGVVRIRGASNPALHLDAVRRGPGCVGEAVVSDVRRTAAGSPEHTAAVVAGDDAVPHRRRVALDANANAAVVGAGCHVESPDHDIVRRDSEANDRRLRAAVRITGSAGLSPQNRQGLVDRDGFGVVGDSDVNRAAGSSSVHTGLDRREGVVSEHMTASRSEAEARVGVDGVLSGQGCQASVRVPGTDRDLASPSAFDAVTAARPQRERRRAGPVVLSCVERAGVGTGVHLHAGLAVASQLGAVNRDVRVPGALDADADEAVLHSPAGDCHAVVPAVEVDAAVAASTSDYVPWHRRRCQVGKCERTVTGVVADRVVGCRVRLEQDREVRVSLELVVVDCRVRQTEVRRQPAPAVWTGVVVVPDQVELNQSGMSGVVDGDSLNVVLHDVVQDLGTTQQPSDEARMRIDASDLVAGIAVLDREAVERVVVAQQGNWTGAADCRLEKYRVAGPCTGVHTVLRPVELHAVGNDAEAGEQAGSHVDGAVRSDDVGRRLRCCLCAGQPGTTAGIGHVGGAVAVRVASVRANVDGTRTSCHRR